VDEDGVPDQCDPCPLDNPDDFDGDGVCDSDPVPLPPGLIVPFNGSEIPEGWLVCNGEDGTPDLRGRFILGTLDDEPGTIGGTTSHSHEGFTDVTSMSSGHTSPGGRSCGPPGCWCTAKASNAAHSHDMTHDHTIDTGESLPPYYEVVFLMQSDATSLPPEALMAVSDETVGEAIGDLGWTLRTELNGRLMRGSSDLTTGATGGSETHDHGGFTGMETATGVFPGSHGMTVTSHGPSTTDLGHSHPYEHDHTLSEENHLPPYQTIFWASPSSDDQTPANGTIAMWSGTLDEIPRGWELCDGGGETPDLSGLFLMGTDAPDALGMEGGETEHVHSMDTDPGGTTGSSGGGNGQCSGGGSLMAFHSHSVPTHTHTMAPNANEPPFFSLAYIMFSVETPEEDTGP